MATETSSKMASTLCQNGYKHPFFYQKAQIFIQFGPYDFVRMSLAYGTTIFFFFFKECMERLETSNVSISNGSTEGFK